MSVAAVAKLSAFKYTKTYTCLLPSLCITLANMCIEII